ncbi:MAG: MFS transporter [Oscillospiraceae bacterium]|nr:MFS transporter [Oscillospiraceae bacterium]
MDTEARRVKRLQICIFIAYTIAFAVPNFSQYQLMPLATRLMNDLNLTPAQFTSIFSAPMLPAIFLSLICGVLVDKLGYKYVIAGAIIMTALGIYGRLFATNYTQLYICMILLGTSAGCVTATGSKIIGSFYEMKRVGVFVGYAVTIGTATMIIASATTAMMSTKTAFIIAAVFVTVDLIVWFVLGPKNKDVLIKGTADESRPSIGKCLATVLKNKYVWYVAIGLACVNGAMVGMNSLISAALVSRGMTETAAGAISSFTLVGNLVGSLLVPTLAARTGKTRLVLIIFSIIAALCTAFSWRAPFGVGLYVALFLTGLGVGSVLPQLMAINIRLPGVGPVYSGTAGGVIATIQLIGGVLIPTYIANPIAGGRYGVYFIVCGSGMIICALFMLLLPRSLDEKV